MKKILTTLHFKNNKGEIESHYINHDSDILNEESIELLDSGVVKYSFKDSNWIRRTIYYSPGVWTELFIAEDPNDS